jgi:hypothetical protein
MKREFSPLFLAVFLILGGTLFSLISSRYPIFMPNVSPLMAIAYVGAMYLPRRWGWLVGPAVFLITNLAYLETNYLVNGSMFSWGLLANLAVFAAAGGLGLLISFHKSIGRIIAGSLACSLLFYVVSNTVSWLYLSSGYAQTFAGWWQANTVGLAGYEPTWHFLRNAMAGDLFFVLLLVLVLDRNLILGRAPFKVEARTA